jgi:hypothetical protein
MPGQVDYRKYVNHHSQSHQSAYLEHTSFHQTMVIIASFRIIAGIGPHRKPKYFILYQKAERLVNIPKARNIDYSGSAQREERKVCCAHGIFSTLTDEEGDWRETTGS